MPLCGFAIGEIDTPPNARYLGYRVLTGIGVFLFFLVGLVVVHRLPGVRADDAERAISTRNSEEVTWDSVSE